MTITVFVPVTVVYFISTFFSEGSDQKMRRTEVYCVVPSPFFLFLSGARPPMRGVTARELLCFFCSCFFHSWGRSTLGRFKRKKCGKMCGFTFFLPSALLSFAQKKKKKKKKKKKNTHWRRGTNALLHNIVSFDVCTSTELNLLFFFPPSFFRFFF